MNDSSRVVKKSDGLSHRCRTQGFGKSLKIKRSREIGAVVNRGQRYACGYFTICYTSNGRPWSRYAFITPRAIGSAVVRNRARRIMRELVRKEPCRGAHLDILFRLSGMTVSAGEETLKGALAQWYETLKK